MLELLKRYQQYDPATTSLLEIALLYPGVRAQAFHAVAHRLYRIGIPFLPRLVSELGRFLSGIEIHPGAKFGRGVIIDHGMGTVIGQTAEIGDRCILYQGVTLGGTDLKRVKRHPTLECDVVVGAGAKVLGNILIGRGTRIGSNSVVIEAVPAYSTVVGIPGRVIRQGVEPGQELCHEQIRER